MNPSFFYLKRISSVSNLQIYIDRLALSGVAADSVTYMYNEMQANGLLAKIKAWYPLRGDTAVKQKYNLVDPLNEIEWFGGGTFTENGFLGNGANAYGKTGFIPSVKLNVLSNGITIISGTENTIVKTEPQETGAYQSGVQAFISSVKTTASGSTNAKAFRLNGAVLINTATSSKGVFTAVRNGSTMSPIFNKLLLAEGSANGSLPTIESYIGTMNSSGTTYTNGFSNQRIQGILYHDGMTLAEVQIMQTILETGENMISRKTW